MVTDSQEAFNHDLGQLLGAFCQIIKGLRAGYQLSDEDYQLLEKAASVMCSRADDFIINEGGPLN